MSVPLDRLYSFLQTVCDQDIIIYRFSPHGSKKWHECVDLYLPSIKEQLTSIPAVFHDQEPLTTQNIPMPIARDFKNNLHFVYNVQTPVCYLKFLRTIEHSPYNNILLVHSEKRSQDVEMLPSRNLIPVYYWSHAIIARDWFRYAEHDLSLKQNVCSVPFLIYSRAWAGTREYRMKFKELLIEENLHSYCNVKFSVEENGKPYTRHVFKNPAFKTTTKFEDFLLKNTEDSSASADYDANDYNNANIEIVLETLFDDTRWHLTEKTLRPIAVGKPFVLAAPPGSLEYLKSYGFKTFSPWIDETYDTIQDPIERLKAIVNVVKKFIKLNYKSKVEILSQCQEIADYNRKLFFSQKFFQQVIDEYKHNIAEAITVVKQTTTLEYTKQWIAMQPEDVVQEAKKYLR